MGKYWVENFCFFIFITYEYLPVFSLSSSPSFCKLKIYYMVEAIEMLKCDHNHMDRCTSNIGLKKSTSISFEIQFLREMMTLTGNLVFSREIIIHHNRSPLVKWCFFFYPFPVMQDAYGDTALHDAIGKENQSIIELLVAYQTTEFTKRNKRGFNVLHHSALKGNVL